MSRILESVEKHYEWFRVEFRYTISSITHITNKHETELKEVLMFRVNGSLIVLVQ